jgi:hypothetical protein
LRAVPHGGVSTGCHASALLRRSPFSARRWARARGGNRRTTAALATLSRKADSTR